MGCWLHEVPSRVNEVGCGPWNSVAWASPRPGGEMPTPKPPAFCGSLSAVIGPWTAAGFSSLGTGLRVAGTIHDEPVWAMTDGMVCSQAGRKTVPVGQGFLRGLTMSQKVEHSHTWNKWIMGLAHICGGEYIITRSDEFLSKIYVLEVLFELIYWCVCASF